MPVIRRVSVSPVALLTILLAPPASAAKPVLVRLQTTAGPITTHLEMQHAPITAGNFLPHAQEKRFDGTFFHHAARNKRTLTTGLVQRRINHRMVRARLPIAHEPTSRTGLSHVDGTVSMVRKAPAAAMSNFFYTVGSPPYLNARPGSVGYAAFGKVVPGMPIVRKMLAAPAYPGGGTATTKGQQIIAPIPIISARHVQ